MNFLKKLNQQAVIVFSMLSLKFSMYKFAIKSRNFIPVGFDRKKVKIDREQKKITKINYKTFLDNSTPLKTKFMKTQISLTQCLQYNKINRKYLYNAIHLQKTVPIHSKKRINTGSEDKIVNTFVYRLSNLNPLQIELIRQDCTRRNKRSITILSSFKLSNTNKRKLITVIKEKIATNARIKFIVDSSKINNIKLCAREYKISWDLKHYIIELNPAVA